MQRDLQASLPTGEGSGAYPMAFAGQTTDDFCFNAMFSGVSLQTFVSLNQEKSLGSLPDYGTSTFPVTDATGFGFSSEDFTALQQKQVGECSKQLKMPKKELVENEEKTDNSSEPFTFTSNSSDTFPILCDSSFHHLPELRSVEQFSTHAESSHKRVRSYSPTDSYTLDAIVKSFKLSNCFSAPYRWPDAPPPPVVPQSSLARQRRQKISDKTRCLQKLMPWDKKMDMATMLEEAYKYIKFLQAQIRALQSMPCDSNFVPHEPINDTGPFGGLTRLNRQQLLQVLVNSPVAQTMLYSRGCCVFSLEQLILLKKLAESRLLLQHLLFDPSKLS